jgi:hypothetical protein
MDNNMESEVLDQLYTVTAGMRPDYINPTADGFVSWRSIQSTEEDSKLAFDSWQQGSYKIFSSHCATIRETRWIGTEMRDHPTYDDTSLLNKFLTVINEKLMLEKRLSVLDITLKDTPTRWWVTHRASLLYWEDAK